MAGKVGNPEIGKYRLERHYNWDEPCSAKLTLRMPPSLYDELRSQEEWQEFARLAIAEKLKKEEGRGKKD